MKKYTSSKSTKDKKGIKNDQFYTNSEVAKKIVDYIKSQKWFNKIEKIIEPSAGSGSFSDLFENCDAYDIDPQKNNIKKVDFLELSVEKVKGILVVGNPPFGRQGSLALKFIKKSCEFADYIAFILPRSFCKASVQNKVPLNFWLDHEEKLEPDSFHLRNGKIHSVPCVFQIWHHNKIPRSKIKNKESKYFSWTDKVHADVAIRRVGFYAGQIKENKECRESCAESHYYIKEKNIPMELICNCFKTINWSIFSSQVSGPRSLSRSEIVELFDKQFDSL